LRIRRAAPLQRVQQKFAHPRPGVRCGTLRRKCREAKRDIIAPRSRIVHKKQRRHGRLVSDRDLRTARASRREYANVGGLTA
jgi:hypothetical protein